MKRLTTLLILFMTVLVLSACGDKKKQPEAAEPKEVEKQSEMTETAALNYLEQITFRYIKISDYENGSFEQKSELQAAIKKCDSVIEEINEKYEEIPIATEIINIAEQVKKASQEVLDGNYETIYDNAVSVGVEVGELSEEHLDGDLPPTLKSIMN